MQNSDITRKATAILALAFAMTGTVMAAEDVHAGHLPEAKATSPAGTTPPTALPGLPAEVAANMKKMQEQMAAIRATTEPKERTRLLEEHMQAMQTTMQMMQKGNGCMTMSGNGMPMHGTAAGGGMGMMQMMMDQMMQHQKAVAGATE